MKKLKFLEDYNGDIVPALLPGEKWVSLPKEKTVAISNYGRVFYQGKVRRLFDAGRGYLGFHYPDLKRQSLRVHIIVAEIFIGPRPKGLVINHKDGNRQNNHVSNLEYITHRENIIHGFNLRKARSVAQSVAQ